MNRENFRNMKIFKHHIRETNYVYTKIQQLGFATFTSLVHSLSFSGDTF